MSKYKQTRSLYSQKLDINSMLNSISHSLRYCCFILDPIMPPVLQYA